MPTNIQENIQRYRHGVNAFIGQLSDIRLIGVLVFLGIALLISWSCVKAINTNYGLQKQIALLQQQNDVQQLSDSDLALQNEYYNTNQYLELQARQNFGLGAPGETEFIIPKQVALAHTVNLPSGQTPAAKVAQKASTYQRNFQAWMDFLLHRQPVSD
ncbi:MAG TPA: septum formation initiator family protein [Candidatus Saccharimonadales bacterium]|nr:septum formation initiator family protein [Candidatus Saccharimonadales bacterium]